jgi:hypothetical protein
MLCDSFSGASIVLLDCIHPYLQLSQARNCLPLVFVASVLAAAFNICISFPYGRCSHHTSAYLHRGTRKHAGDLGLIMGVALLAPVLRILGVISFTWGRRE